MALSLLDRAKLRQNGDFQLRIREAIAIIAGDIISEGPNVPDTSLRKRWAASALRDSGTELVKFMPQLLREPTILGKGAEASDDEIILVVKNLVNSVGLADQKVEAITKAEVKAEADAEKVEAILAADKK